MLANKYKNIAIDVICDSKNNQSIFQSKGPIKGIQYFIHPPQNKCWMNCWTRMATCVGPSNINKVMKLERGQKQHVLFEMLDAFGHLNQYFTQIFISELG